MKGTTMELVTVKVTEETRRILKIIAAMTGEKMHEVAERLVKAEEKQLATSKHINRSSE